MKHQKLARLFALTLPLLGAVASAHAQSDYRYNDGVNNGVYNNNGYNNGGVYNNVNGDRLRGTVERVYSNREFDLRLKNGDIVRVKTDSYLNLRQGDRTAVNGAFRGKTFYAEAVNRRDDNAPGYQNREGRVNLQGEVVEVEGRRTLRVRADDGRVYRVQSQNVLNSRISRGDLISVRGTFDGSFVRADNGQVRLLSDDNRIDGNYGNRNGYGNGTGYGNGNGNGNGSVYRNDNVYGNPNYGANDGVYGRGVSFPATVRVVRRGEVEVRGDNGRIYVVRLGYTDRNTLRVGDRVRVEGVTHDGFIESTRLNPIY